MTKWFALKNLFFAEKDDFLSMEKYLEIFYAKASSCVQIELKFISKTPKATLNVVNMWNVSSFEVLCRQNVSWAYRRSTSLVAI